jgi:hypothetical protein
MRVRATGCGVSAKPEKQEIDRGILHWTGAVGCRKRKGVREEEGAEADRKQPRPGPRARAGRPGQLPRAGIIGRDYDMSLPTPPGVVITGIGVVSPFGVGRQRFWHHVSRGCSGTKAITQFDVSTYPSQVAAWVPPVSIDDAPALEGDDRHDGRADPKRYSRAALFGVVAAREAWHDAGLRIAEPRSGVIIGSGGGGIDVGETQYEDFFTAGGKHVTPYAIAIGICGMVSSEISISLGLRGMSHVLVVRLHQFDRRPRLRDSADSSPASTT